MTQENVRRMVEIIYQAEQDNITPNEYVRRKIQRAISHHNPLINPSDTFLVLGIDGHDYSMFPFKSFKDIDEAKSLAISKMDEHYLFTDINEPPTTFHVFTLEGIHIPLRSTASNEFQV